MNWFFIESSSGFKNSSEPGTTLMRKFHLTWTDLVNTEKLSWGQKLAAALKNWILACQFWFFMIKFFHGSFIANEASKITFSSYNFQTSLLKATPQRFINMVWMNNKEAFLAQGSIHTLAPHQLLVAATVLSHRTLRKPRHHLHKNFVYVSSGCAFFVLKSIEQQHKAALKEDRLELSLLAADKNVSIAHHKFRAFLVTIVQRSGSSRPKGSRV